MCLKWLSEGIVALIVAAGAMAAAAIVVVIRIINFVYVYEDVVVNNNVN